MPFKDDIIIHNSTYGTFTFRGVNILEHPLDSEFYDLFHRSANYLLSGQKILVDSLFTQNFIELSIEYFKTRTLEKGSNIVEIGDKFIENLTILPNSYAGKGDLRSSYQVWLTILRLIIEVEQKSNITIHKGTAYYFAGGNAIEIKDFESGMLMMHLALKEDVKYNPNWKSTPAYSFMTIDSKNVSQFHRILVNAMANIVKNRILGSESSYVKNKRGNLVYEDFRMKFLENEKLIPDSARYYFVYSLLRFWHMRIIHKSGLVDDVVSPMAFGNTIGSLILVIETLLKSVISPDKETTLAPLIKALNLGIDCSILQQSRRIIGFDALLHQLIKQDDIKSDFEIAYLCRNQIFHVIENKKIYVDHYTEITQAVFNCIFYTVEKYYK